MQKRQFALGNFVTLIIFIICLMSLSVGIVFAYFPSLKFSASTEQTLTTCTLSHNNKILFTTDSSSTVDGAVGTTYIVQPISSNTVQVKCTYGNLSKTSTTNADDSTLTDNVISFSATSQSGVISRVVTYGVNVTNESSLCTLSNEGSVFTVTLITGPTYALSSEDEIILDIQFS